ncbi:hypothetical protein K493DRAFT_316336 [Basidiobolus meristosporus CBS 931.73]|uniref:HeH/LEM domain-containing protein n=1 Tax=Basidiobolus meristosporus CBS 931.73 TaxID=1314790 RepID=A0A1Y1Y4M1_9FUNG|nr:hypothetical protein K493DRAFT_316336 [Basidiobolus meristosporus CBS 931.73]|eukprot:ORX92855.1 hypothetical protein K493DRAFT_316336 [Basidiobolus meristosporus CBS 931.73]
MCDSAGNQALLDLEEANVKEMKCSELRRILIEHGVEFNLTLKKPELVSLVREKVIPQLVKCRANISEVQPSSEGIIFVGF